MLVPIRGPEGELQEWALIELQGKFDSQVEGIGENDLSTLGALLATHKDVETLQLTIGYHQLEGKRVPLKKAFLILDKSTAEAPDSQGDAAAMDIDTHSGTDDNTTLIVRGIIRHKYLFKTRPRALISKPAHRT